MYGALITNALMIFLSLILVLAPFFLLAMIFIIPFCPDQECAGYWKRFPFVLLQVLAIPAGFFVITMFLVIGQMRGYLSEHFDEYKCSPWFMPFVSWIRPDVSATSNFEQCLGSVSRVVQGALMSPMMDIAAELNGGQNIQADNVDRIQQSLAHKQHSTSQLFFRMNNQMGALQAIGKTLMLKIGALFTNVMELVYDLYYALLSMASFYEGLICMPQMILLFMKIVGGFTLATGLVEIGFGTEMLMDGAETVAEGVPLEPVPVTNPIGDAIVAIGAFLTSEGGIMLEIGTVSVVVGTIYLAISTLFLTNLNDATAANNALISAQMEQLERAQRNQEVLAQSMI